MPFLTQGKTNWKFIFIVIVLAVIAGAGILWCQKISEQLYPLQEIKEYEEVIEDKTADPVPNEVEGWQTYRNEKYGFEFEYPVKYFLTKISDEEISISKYAEPVEFGYFGTDIKIIQNTQSLSPEEWLAQNRADFGFGENDLIVGLERIITGAGNALKFNGTWFDLPYAVIESNNLSTRQLIIISGGKDDDVFEVIIDTITAQP